jgi:hypothetical protein
LAELGIRARKTEWRDGEDDKIGKVELDNALPREHLCDKTIEVGLRREEPESRPAAVGVTNEARAAEAEAELKHTDTAIAPNCECCQSPAPNIAPSCDGAGAEEAARLASESIIFDSGEFVEEAGQVESRRWRVRALRAEAESRDALKATKKVRKRLERLDEGGAGRGLAFRAQAGDRQAFPRRGSNFGSTKRRKGSPDMQESALVVSFD